MVDSFSFSALNKSYPRYMVFMVSDESAIHANLSLLSPAFKILPESVAFGSLMLMCICGSLEFIYLEFIELIGGTDCFSSNLRVSAVFLQIFCLFLSLHYFWDSHHSYVETFACTLQVSEALLIFFLFLKIDHISMNCFQVHLVFLLPFQVCHWDWPQFFHINYQPFQLQGFYDFKLLPFFIGILYLMRSLIFLLFFRHCCVLFLPVCYIWIPYLSFCQ